MTITDAVIARTVELTAEKHFSKKEFTEVSGLPRETKTSIYKKPTKNVTLTTVRGLALGLR